jgi:hypothetical protein
MSIRFFSVDQTVLQANSFDPSFLEFLLSVSEFDAMLPIEIQMIWACDLESLLLSPFFYPEFAAREIDRIPFCILMKSQLRAKVTLAH